jgi:hypoxanthine-DNA glycosylase
MRANFVRNGNQPMKSFSFDAVASANARVLILGTLPSVRSLEQGEYYAHPRNSFWWIMSKLIGSAPELPYAERLQRLRASGIALWDVCRAAEREGSSDAKIRIESIEANDFRAFLASHPQIELICFNGQPAQKLFRAKASPLLAGIRPIPQRVLDSTSPANARVTREEKLLRWREAISPYFGPNR